MTRIGVITRGKYGLRLIENLKKTNFKVSSIELPALIPNFIEEPEEFINSLIPEKSLFSSNLIISYALHPDLTPEIVKLSGKNKSKAIIIAGSGADKNKLFELSKKYNIYVEVHEICCCIKKGNNSVVNEFASYFGDPVIEITTKEDIITDVKVIKSSPCGSTYFMADGLLGVNVKDAPTKGGLLIQHYPCRAVRGIKGGIHKAASIHKRAVEKAIENITLGYQDT